MKPLNTTCYLFFIALLLFSQYAQTQNIVPNPSFEILDPGVCPTGNGQIYNTTGWYSPTNNGAELYTACHNGNFGVPINNLGVQAALTDSCYAGFFAYRPSDKRSYIAIKLAEPLTPGKSYCGGFNVSLADLSYIAVNNIGMYFSADSIFSNTSSNLGFTPQIEHNGGFIDDKNNWTNISGSFTATETYEWLIIGNFYDNANTDTLTLPGGVGTLSQRAYYYVEDVSLLALEDIVVTGGMLGTSTLQVCEGGSTTLTATGGDAYIWVDASNPFDTLSTNNTLDIASASATTSYLLTVGTGACSRQQIITLDVLPLPTVNFQAQNTCAGYTTYFTNLSTGITPDATVTWDFGDGSLVDNINGGAEHTYATAGTYTVTLSVNNAEGCVANSTISLTISDCTACEATANLVPNPNFEQYTICPFDLRQLDFAQHWYSPTNRQADLFHACSDSAIVDVPTNYLGSETPYNGNGYGGFLAYTSNNRRSYVAVPLTQTLVADSVYCVSFNVSLGDNVGVAVENIGAYFNNGSLNIATNGPLFITPDVVNNNGILANQTGWTTISGLYTPSTAVDNLIIGNFNDNSATNFASLNAGVPPLDQVSYYYIDAVSVVKLPKLDLPNDTTFVCVHSPFQLSAPTGFCGYNWYDQNGTVLGNEATVSVSAASAGTRYYVVRTEFNGCFQSDTVVVNYQAYPETDFNVVSGCAGNISLFNNLTQNADNSTAFYWDFDSDNNTDIQINGLGDVAYVYSVPDTIYEATLVALSAAGCADTSIYQIYVSGDCDPCQQQNAIVNSDFAAAGCPTTLGNINTASLWQSPLNSTAADIFAACGNDIAGIPNNQYGTQGAYSGNHYAGIQVYDPNAPEALQQFVAQQLLTPLQVGQTYCFKMRVSLADNSSHAIDELGAYFSATAFDAANGATTPQVSNQVGGIISDTIGWREISGSFVAGTDYNYITIGNFVAYTPNALSMGGSENGAYYYIDEVSVSPLTLSMPSDATICAGQSILLTANTTTCSYYWTTAANPNEVLSDSLSILVTPSQTTDYIFWGSNGNCDIQDTVTITVNPLPYISSNDTAICAGSSINIQATGGDNYLWSDGSNTDNITVTPTETSYYSVTISNSATGCNAIDSVQVAILPQIIADAGDNINLCYGDSTQLIATGGNVFAWQADATLSSTDIADPYVNPTSSTWYYVTVSNSANGCNATDSVFVNVLPQYNISNIPELNVCVGDSLQLVHPDIPNNATSYSWTPNNNIIDPTVMMPWANPSINTVYSVTFSDANGCIGTASVSVIVNPTPDAGDDVQICTGASVQLNASSGGTTYSWLPTDGLNDANIQNPIATPATTTTYVLTVSYPNGNIACVSTDSITVFVSPQGFADINVLASNLPQSSSGNPIICSGQSLDLQAFGGDGFMWSTDPSISTALDNDTISVAPLLTTTYYVEVSNSLTTCTILDSITVEVRDDLTPDIDENSISAYYCTTFAAPTTICLNGTYEGCQFLAMSVSGGQGSASSVNDGDFCFVYQPTPNDNLDTLTVNICTVGSNLCDNIQVVIINNQCDQATTDAPTWSNANIADATYSGVPVDMALPAVNDPNTPAGDSFTYSVATPANGTASIVNGVLIYTPNSDFVGTEVFEVTVCDNFYPIECAVLTVTVVVEPLPTCANEELAACGRPNSAVELCFDFCLLNNPVVNLNTSTCDYCQLLVNPNSGCVVYIPQVGIQNIDTVYVSATDPATGFVQTAMAVVNIGCSQPTAQPDFVSTTACVPLRLNALLNDSDPCNDLLFMQLSSNNTANGIAQLNSDGTITYESNPGFSGNDTIYYSACNSCDLGTRCVESFVVVNVLPNAAPEVQNLVYNIHHLSPLSICIPYSDAEGAAVNTAIAIQPNAGGQFYNFNNNCFSYAPTVLLGTVFNSTTFTVQTCDDCGNCVTSEVTINFTGNQAPISQDTTVTTPYNTPISVCLDITEPDGDDYDLSIISTVSNGSILLQNDSCILFTPANNYSGTTTISVLVCDEFGSCDDITTITIVVEPSLDNLPPDVTVSPVSTNENTATTVCLGVSDPDGDDIVFPITIADPDCGTVVADDNTACFNFVPDAGFSGTCTVMVTVCDVLGNCSEVAVPITVVDNLPPVVTVTPATTTVDESVNVCLTATDPEGNAISPLSIADPDCGEAIPDAEGLCFLFAPNGGFIGTCIVLVTVCDELGNCTTVEVPINVITDGNSAPVIEPISPVTNYNTPIDICLNVTDPDGDAITFPITVSDPACGTVVADDNTACFNFMPNVGFSGTCTVSATVCDELGNCSTINIPITVNPPANTPPVVVNETVVTTLNTPINICVEASDADEDPLTLNNVLPGNDGTVENVNANTFCFDFIPDAGFIGTTTVVVQICDDNGACDTGVITVNVQEPANLPPLFTDYSTTVLTGVAATICVDDYVSDPNGDVVVLTTTTGANNGIANPGTPGDLCFTYTSNDGFVGTDTIDVTVCDSEGLCTVGQVIINVVENNEAPVIVLQGPDIILQGTTYQSNCIVALDPNDPTDISLISWSPNVGSMALVPSTDPNCESGLVLQFTPPADFTGVVYPYIVACDALGACTDTTALVAIIVNDAPIMNDQSFTLTQNASINICPVFTDNIGYNGGPSVDDGIHIIDAPNNGTATISANDSCFIYTPTSGFIGNDTLTITYCDAYNVCDTATIYITVTDPFIAFDNTATTEDGVAVTINVQNNDTGNSYIDIMSISDAPNNGTATINGNNIVYTPNIGFIGSDTLYYVICDNTVTTNYGCDTAMVIINVSNQLSANDDVVTTEQSTSINIAVQSNDTVPATLTPTLLDAPANGVIIPDGNGGFTYLPDANFVGLDSFTYVISYPGYGSDTATVYITVTPDTTPDPVVANDDQGVTSVNQPIAINVIGNDTNPNGNGLTVTIVTQPTSGTVVVNADGTVTYTPATNASGNVSFTYQACDPILNLCDTATVSITIIADIVCDVIVYGVITPNGDNLNEELQISGLTCSENANNSISIFNRWGNLVYQADNYGSGDLWNGTWQKNGELLPDGTYFYVLEIEGKDLIKGYIELSR
jgi:gliding motility-associated-like protein